MWLKDGGVGVVTLWLGNCLGGEKVDIDETDEGKVLPLCLIFRIVHHNGETNTGCEEGERFER